MKTNERKATRLPHRLLWIGGAVALFACCAVIGINALIRHSIVSVADSRFTVGAVRWITFSRSILLRNVCLIDNKDSVMVQIDACSLRNIRRRGNSWTIDSVTLYRPTVTLHATEAERPRRDNKAHGTKYKLKLTVCALRIVNGRVQHATASHEVDDVLRAIVVQSDTLSLDPTGKTDRPVRLSDFRCDTPQSGARWRCETISFDLSTGKLTLKELQRIPIYPAGECVLLSPTHTDWTRIGLQNVTCYGTDLRQMASRRAIVLDSIVLHSGTIRSSKNRNLPQPKRCKPMFYDLLQRLPLTLNIGPVTADSLVVIYRETPIGADSACTVRFDRLKLRIPSISHPAPTDTKLIIDASARFMDHTALQTHIKMPLETQNAQFTIDGAVAAGDMVNLNLLTEGLGHLRIDSGRLDTLTFNMVGDTVSSTTTLCAMYNNLWITLLRDSRDTLQDNRFTTVLANRFVIRHNNPDRNGIRIGIGITQRDPFRSQFNYIWKSIEAGLFDIIKHRRDSHPPRR